MASVCFYFQVHQPYRLRRYSVFDCERNYFDNVKNAEICRKVGSKCYLPANRLLLDNFSNNDLLAAVAARDSKAPDIGLEASGGISLKTVRAVAETGVDFISVGALTKDIRAVDLSMRLELA